LTAPVRLSGMAVKEFLREGRKESGGAILNVGSYASLHGGAAGVAYTASKHGLVGLTKNTAANYTKKGIRCNIILPGSMRTNIQTAFEDGMNMEGYTYCAKLMEMNPAPVDTDD